jgi:hypothetical protein
MSSSGFGHARLFIGKSEDRAASVELKDAQGRARLRLRVAGDGAAAIEFLDENGKSLRTVTPTSK